MALLRRRATQKWNRYVQVASTDSLSTVITNALDGDVLIVEGTHTVNNKNLNRKISIRNKPGQRAQINGRLVFRASGIEIDGGGALDGMILNGDYASLVSGEPSWTVTAPDCTIKNVTFTNANRTIGVNAVTGGDRLTVTNFYMYDVGLEQATTTGLTTPYLHNDNGLYSGNLSHGFYLSADSAYIAYGEIKNAADRAVQLRGSTNGLVEYIWAHACGMGVIYGDLSATNNVVRYSTFENNQITGRYCVESFGSQSGNSFQGYASTVEPSIPVTVTNTNPSPGRSTAYGPSWMT